MRKLMVLGAGLNQIPIIDKALSGGLDVLAVDPNSNAPGLVRATESACFDLADLPKGVAAARAHGVNGVVTLAADFPMPMLAEICDALGLAGPNMEAVRKSTDKAEMRRAFSKHGVCNLDFVEVEEVAHAIDIVRSRDFSTIFKPGVSSGGRGICRIAPNASITDITSAFHNASIYSANKRVIVEKLVKGTEYSVEAMAAKGELHIAAITAKTTTGAPYFVEVAHSQPAALPARKRDLLAETTRGAIEACGIDNAPVHAEIRLTDEGPVIMEIAARLGGGFISSHLTPLATGIDLIQAAIDVALGEKPILTAHNPAGSAIEFLVSVPGRVVSVSGLEAVRSDPNCIDAQVYVQVGEEVGRLRNATDRAGHVITRGDTAELARTAAEYFAGLIKIETT